MKLSYKKLWVMLVERDMKRICEALKCDISDICEIVPDEAVEERS